MSGTASINISGAPGTASAAAIGVPGVTGPGQLFGLQDAYEMARSSETEFTLFSDGCRHANGTGPTNCTEACVNQSSLWDDKYSMLTMANCLTYPRIAEAMATRRLDNDSVLIAESFGILPATIGTYNASFTAQAINICWIEYCSENNPCDFWNGEVDGHSFSLLEQGCDRLNVTVDGPPSNPICIPDPYRVCHQVPDVGSVNNDLGGPGVFVSYVIQYVVCLLAFVVLSILDFAIHGVVFFLVPGPIYWLMRHPKGLHGGWRVAARAQRLVRQKLGSQHDAWMAALIEFQKTQAFFSLSIAIAVLVQIAGHLNTVDAKTLQQLENNIQLFSITLYGGLYPLVFTLMLLRRHGLNTPFVTALAVLSVIASTIAMRMAATTNLTRVPIRHGAANLETCARVNPTKYCHYWDPVNTWWKSILSPYPALVILPFQILDTARVLPGALKYDEETGHLHHERISIFAWLYRRLEQRKFWADVEAWVVRYSTFLRKAGFRSRTKILNAGFWSVRLLIECIIWIILLIILLVIISIEGPANNDEALEDPQFNTTNWTFGQITAMLFWAPPIVEYLRIALSDYMQSQNSHIPQEYKIVRRNDAGNADADADATTIDPLSRAATDMTMVEGRDGKHLAYAANQPMPSASDDDKLGAMESALPTHQPAHMAPQPLPSPPQPSAEHARRHSAA